jgi:signal transduction histidine kinase
LFSNWPIRVKLLVGLGLLLLVVTALSSSGLYATYCYRSLVKNLSWRAVELPLAAELNTRVNDLRNTLSELQGIRTGSLPRSGFDQYPLRSRIIRDSFSTELQQVETTLDDYRDHLQHKFGPDSKIADTQREWETVHKIEAALAAVRNANRDHDWMLDDFKIDGLETELENLQQLAAELPSHLHKRLSGFAAEVRGQYHGLFGAALTSSLVAGLVFGLFVKLFYQWIFVPLRILIGGSRRVAGGEFSYRIHLDTRDEMAELAEAMNLMTTRFQSIRDDLDRQVQERTKQVVRNEQLASVGFLAAGVAHEINNPLASIALCAESLESRTQEFLDPQREEHAVVFKYLRMIQTEAFRCKEITEKLLDFSRTGQARRQAAELGSLVRGVVEMVGHLGRHQHKHIEFQAAAAVVASVNAQEIKQVVLNLLTNALECVDEEGHVWITVRADGEMAEIVVRDDGCGMEPAVLDRVFEPFYTRRKAGQGTGLGLSITHRIVADHGGDIRADSPGPGQGATFHVRLPLAARAKEIGYQYQAA